MLEWKGTLLSAATEGSAVASLGRSCDLPTWTFFVTGSEGVTAGKVQISTAPTADYAGDWEPFGAEITVPDDGTLSVTGESAARHFKAEITTTIVDGTVTVTAEAVS